MVRVRGGYSDVSGISPCNNILQTDEFDDATRVQINNLLFKMLGLVFDHENGVFQATDGMQNISHSFCENLLNDVLCQSTILREGSYFNWRLVYENRISVVITDAEYNEVLDILQYICEWVENRLYDRFKGSFFNAFNSLFEREYVGYRFVDRKIVSITDKNETQSIEDASIVPFDGCRAHIKKAIGFIADRENKDYKNSIKESISAVESICEVIVGKNKATLNDALRIIEKKGTVIHPALNQAFQKLYAYTSDQGGIRHSDGMFESNVTFEEAKFMLVSCSAFINYLIAEYGKGSK